jgi:hypothetical protein
VNILLQEAGRQGDQLRFRVSMMLTQKDSSFSTHRCHRQQNSANDLGDALSLEILFISLADICVSREISVNLRSGLRGHLAFVFLFHPWPSVVMKTEGPPVYYGGDKVCCYSRLNARVTQTLVTGEVTTGQGIYYGDLFVLHDWLPCPLLLISLSASNLKRPKTLELELRFAYPTTPLTSSAAKNPDSSDGLRKLLPSLASHHILHFSRT